MGLQGIPSPASNDCIHRVWKSLPIFVTAGVLITLFAFLRPEYLHHWDGIQLTLGLERFDLVSHHPHPPGYYLFIILGRVLSLFVADPADALRFVSILSCGVIVGLVGWMLPSGLRIGVRVVFLLGIVIFMVGSAVLLPYGVVALTYASEAACWLGILLGLASRPRGARLAVLAVFVGVSAGLRQTLLVWGVVVFLLLAVQDRGRLKLRDILAGALGLAVGVLSWFLPMLAEAGGWDLYIQTSQQMLGRTVWARSVFVKGVNPIMAERLPRMVGDLWAALGPVLLLSLATLAGRIHPRWRSTLARWDALPLGGVVAFVFYLLIVYESTGYILPVAVVLGAYGFAGIASIASVLGRVGQIWAGSGALAAAAVLCLLPGGIARDDQVGYRELLWHDAVIERSIATLESGFRPEDTILVTSRDNWAWSFRHSMYYLPEFTTFELAVDPCLVGTRLETPYVMGRDRRIEHVGPEALDLAALPRFRTVGGARNIVYMIAPDMEVFLDPSCFPAVKRKIQVGPREVFLVFEIGDSVHLRVIGQRLVCSG